MKFRIIFFSFLFAISLFSSYEEPIYLVRIDLPDTASLKKRSVQIIADDILKVIENDDIKKMTVNIDFATTADFVIARLGKIEKGKISWSDTPDSANRMTVKFGKPEYKDLIEKIEAGNARPGYQIILSDPGSNRVLSSREITFKAFPNLAVELEYPVNASPGESLGGKITLRIKNSGNEASGEFDVDLVLAEKFEIPVKRYDAAGGTEGVRLIKNGRLRAGPLEAGAAEEIKIPENLRMPEDVAPGKYYMGAIADPGNEIAESIEEDNVFKGFIVISPRVPKKIIVTMEGTILHYITKTFGLTVHTSGMEISISDEWRKCQIRPYIFHLMHTTWRDFFWEINTDEKMVWKITRSKFCERGKGDAEQLNIKVIPAGGSTSEPPSSFKLIVKETKIIYNPGDKKYEILLAGCPMTYLPFWKTCRNDSSNFHFKYATWDREVWEMNLSGKKFRKIPMEKMCRESETGEEIPSTLQLVEEGELPD